MPEAWPWYQILQGAFFNSLQRKIISGASMCCFKNKSIVYSQSLNMVQNVLPNGIPDISNLKRSEVVAITA